MWSSLNVPECISVLTCLLCTCIGLKPFEADMKASMLKIAEGTDEEVKSRFKENVADEDFVAGVLIARMDVINTDKQGDYTVEVDEQQAIAEQQKASDF